MLQPSTLNLKAIFNTLEIAPTLSRNSLKVCHMSILELLVVHFIPSYTDHLKRMGGFRTRYYSYNVN